MGRKKMGDAALLKHPVKTRVNDQVYRRLQELMSNSRHRTISEVIRQILSDKPIKVYHVSADLITTLDEMARIRNEIKMIGHNINQVVKKFHGTPFQYTKGISILMLQQQLEQIENRLVDLDPLISEIGKKWLQK